MSIIMNLEYAKKVILTIPNSLKAEIIPSNISVFQISNTLEPGISIKNLFPLNICIFMKYISSLVTYDKVLKSLRLTTSLPALNIVRIS